MILYTHFQQSLKTNPFFTSLAVISETEITIWIQTAEQNSEVQAHLNKEGCNEQNTCVNVAAYENVFTDLANWAATDLSGGSKVLITEPTRMEAGASYAVYEAIPASNHEFDYSPLIYPRARKNHVEVQGMLNAHIRDAQVLVEFLAILERDVRWKLIYFHLHVKSSYR